MSGSLKQQEPFSEKASPKTKAVIYWWMRGQGHQMQEAEFADYYSDEFDEKLSELESDDEVCIIEIKKVIEP